MSLLEDTLYPASFKGAKFYFLGDSRTDGRRIVVHEYPNKEDDVEDLGKNRRVFNITAVITGFFYHDDKKTLEKALNDIGPGILIHPFLGSINCVCQGFTISETISNVGRAEYTMQFKEVAGVVYPIPATDVTSLLANLYNDLYAFIRDYLNGQYIARFINNIEAAAQKLQQLLDTMNALGSAVPQSNGESKTNYSTAAAAFQDNLYRITSPNGDIGTNVSEIVGLFDNISTNGELRFTASDNLFGYGTDDVFLDFDTFELNQRKNNSKAINAAINTLALTNMYDAARFIQYRDDEQLDTILDALNRNYDILINSDRILLTEDLFEQIDQLRITGKSFFNNIRLNVSRVVEIETNDISVTVLAYKYYGNTDDYDELLDLNAIYNPARVSGRLRILEDE